MSKKIIIYHGSNKVIENHTFGVGNPNNDYGLGFYCTENIEIAKAMSLTIFSDWVSNMYKTSINTMLFAD